MNNYQENNYTKSNLCLLFIIFIFFGIASTLIEPLIPLISEELNIGYDIIGLILLTSSAISLFATFIAGRLSDKYNLRKIIMTGVFLLAAGFIIYGIYPGIVILILTLIFFRIGNGILDSSIHAYVSKLFTGKRSHIFVRLDFFWYIGAIIGPLTVSIFLFFNINTKWLFFIFAFLSAVLLLLYYFYQNGFTVNAGRRKINIPYSKKPVSERLAVHEKKPIADEDKVSYVLILKNPVIILTCTGLFLYIGIFSILSTWLTAYFADFNISVSSGSALLSVFWAFNALGVFLTGRLLAKSNEMSLLIIFSSIGTLSALAYSLIPSVYVKIIFLILQAVFFSGFFPLLNALAVRENIKFSGTILGVTISVAILGLVVFQPLAGYIAEYFGNQGINYLLIAIVLASLISTVILMRVISLKYRTRFKFFNLFSKKIDNA